MIFPVIEVEPVVQVGDKTRISAVKSFASGEASPITLVRIRPVSSGDWFTVTGDDYRDWYLDWAYSAAAEVAPQVEITTNGSPVVVSGAINVVTAATDNLFSTDSDLQLHETDILKWVADGRSSFKDIHRRAQKVILQWLDREGYISYNRTPFTAADVSNIEEVNAWATYTALRIIFEGISNASDDVFREKAIRYDKEALHARSRVVLRLDADNDGDTDYTVDLELSTGNVVRR